MTNQTGLSIVVNAVEPLEEYRVRNREEYLYRQLINFSIARSINYRELSSLSKYPNRDYWHSIGITQTGLTDDQLKNWLINRYMASGHWDDLEFYEQENFKLMKKYFL
ncbi:hypothetical protein ACIL82_03970 [Enterococcus faecium]